MGRRVVNRGSEDDDNDKTREFGSRPFFFSLKRLRTSALFRFGWEAEAYLRINP